MQWIPVGLGGGQGPEKKQKVEATCACTHVECYAMRNCCASCWDVHVPCTCTHTVCSDTVLLKPGTSRHVQKSDLLKNQGGLTGSFSDTGATAYLNTFDMSIRLESTTWAWHRHHNGVGAGRVSYCSFTCQARPGTGIIMGLALGVCHIVALHAMHDMSKKGQLDTETFLL